MWRTAAGWQWQCNAYNSLRQVAAHTGLDFSLLSQRALGVDAVRLEEAYQSFRGINGFVGGDIGELQILANVAYGGRVAVAVYQSNSDGRLTAADMVVEERGRTSLEANLPVTYCLLSERHYYLIHGIRKLSATAVQIDKPHRLHPDPLHLMLARIDASIALAVDSATIAPTHGFISTGLSVGANGAHAAADASHRIAHLHRAVGGGREVVIDLTGRDRSPAGSWRAPRAPTQRTRDDEAAATAGASGATTPNIVAMLASAARAAHAQAAAHPGATATPAGTSTSDTGSGPAASGAPVPRAGPTVGQVRHDATGTDPLPRPPLMGEAHASISTANILPDGAVRRSRSGPFAPRPSRSSSTAAPAPAAAASTGPANGGSIAGPGASGAAAAGGAAGPAAAAAGAPAAAATAAAAPTSPAAAPPPAIAAGELDAPATVDTAVAAGVDAPTDAEAGGRGALDVVEGPASAVPAQ